MSTMTKRERVNAALRGDEIDRVPVGFWGHFPTDPHRAADLAAETLGYQRRFDWDFVKLMPSGMYYPEALGCTLTPAHGPGAVNDLAESVIKRPGDWERLPILDPTEGWLAEHLRSIQLVREAVGPDLPIIETVFSPLTVAHKLSLHVPFEESVQRYRPQLEVGLQAITEGTKRFATAALDAGADGFFYATQEANHDTFSVDDFVELGKRYDLEVLQATADRASFVMLHVCREKIYADLVAEYPVHAINWDSHHTRPSLTEARSIWRQALVGGLDRYGAILNGTPAEVQAEARAAIAEAGSRGFILSAGCALPVACPTENLHAARQAVDA